MYHAPWRVGGIPDDFSFGEIPPDWDRLVAHRPSLAYSVPCLDRSAGDKFLRVDITEVTNPLLVELA